MVSSLEDAIRKDRWDKEIQRDIEIRPQNRIVPALNHEEVPERLRVLGAEVYNAELQTVFEEYRKCGTMHIRSNSLMDDMNLIHENDLVFLPILKCAPVSGFAHRFYEVQPGEPYDVFGVIAKKHSHAEAFRKAFKENDHRTVGRLLGYPECCITFFEKTWPHVVDPFWEYALNGTGKNDGDVLEITGYPECNLILRYFGLRVAPHIYCSPKCESTKKWAGGFLRHIPHRKELLELLSLPMTWDNYMGVVTIRTPWFIGVANSTPYRRRKIVRWAL